MTQRPEHQPPARPGSEAASNVIAFPERPETRAERRRAAAELRNRIADWVNEGGAGDEVKR